MTLPASAFISITYTPSGGLNEIHVVKNVNVHCCCFLKTLLILYMPNKDESTIFSRSPPATDKL